MIESSEVRKTCKYWLLTFWLLDRPLSLYIVSRSVFCTLYTLCQKEIVLPKLYSVLYPLSVLFQVVLAIFTVSDLDLGANSDPLGLVGPSKEFKWESIAEPFLVVYIGSAAIVLLLSMYNKLFYAHFFMQPCALIDADLVMVTHGNHTVTGSARDHRYHSVRISI